MVDANEQLEPEFQIVRRSQECGELFGALAKAQGSMKGAKKDVENSFFKSSYADLESVWEDCRAPLSSNGLAVVQSPAFHGGKVVVSTVLGHSSGQWMESRLDMPINKADAQGVGSAITYARRYALAATVGVAPKGDDDDGNAAVGRDSDKPAKVAKSNGPPKVTPEMQETYKRDLDLLKAAKTPDELKAATEAIKTDEEAGMLAPAALTMLRNVYKERVQGIEAIVELGERLLPSK